MKKMKVLISTIIVLASFLVLPSLSPPVHATPGTICLIDPTSSSCPTNPASLTGTVGTQQRISVFLQGTNVINGFDITLLADHTILKPAGFDLTGSIVPGPQQVALECLGGILITGPVCSGTDTTDTLHLAVLACQGCISSATTGLLFTAIYNVTGTTTGTPVGFQTGCTNTSVSNTCVNITNGTATPVPEAVQTATFSTSTAPDFVMSDNPNSISVMQGSSATSLVSLTSVNGFAGTVNLLAMIGPPGPTVTLSSTSVTLASGGTGTSTLAISTTASTPPGSYVATVNGTSGSLAHFVTIGVGVIGPPPPDFSMSASPTSLAIQAGLSANATITISSLNGFAGTVSLSTSVSNSGPIATLSATSVSLSSGGTGTSILTVSTTTSTPGGSYAVTVMGTSGSLSHQTGVTVTVTGTTSPDFAISASPSSLTLGVGSSGTSTITVTPLNGFTGIVSLTVTPSPGLTASVSPTSITTSGAAILTVSSSATGSYSAAVTGISGSLSHSVTVSVNVPQTGEVCIVNPGSTTCPSNFLTFSGMAGNQLKVSVFIQGTAPMSGFDITLLADHTIFVPAGINLTGSIISTPSAPPSILVECLQGILVAGNTCSITDTIDTLHLAAVAAPGALPGGTTSPGASGLLFTATYNVITTTSGTVINFQTGCSNSSVGGGVCIDIANGTSSPVPETIPSVPSPSFAIAADPTSLTISRGSTGTSIITLTSVGGFTGIVTLSSIISPNNRHGPSITLSTNTVTLSPSGTGTTILTISTAKSTPTGTYTITLTGANGSTSVPITITVTVTK